MKKIDEKVKMTREEVQNKAFELSFEYPYMVLRYPTGLGKTYTMIRIIENTLKKDKKAKCLILEPEIALIDNLKKEFKKFKKQNLLNQIEIICYASLKKVEGKYDILVLDEAHHAFSELRLDLLQNMIPPKYIYLLSATLEICQIKQFEEIMKQEFLCHTISLKRAIEWGILPTPKIGVFLLKLNDKDINTSYEYKRGNKKDQVTITVEKEEYKWKYIKDKAKYPNLHLIVYCTEKQKYDQLCYEAEAAKKRSLDNPRNEDIRQYWLYTELCIKRFLSEIKTPYLDEFLQDVIADNNRFIVFFGSVSQAEELAIKHKANLVASKEKDAQKTIERFNTKEISNLYCCKMINEGVTLTDLEIGVIGQLDGKSGSFIQKVGRSLRSIYPQLYIFSYKDTKDETYLENALTKIDKNYVSYLDYFLV